MENLTTRKFDRLPKDTGIPFSGLEEVRIESRKEVENQITSFISYCKEEATGISARIILGDWGEGKTDTYERIIKPYIKENNDELFFLPTPTLINSYEDESLMNFNKFNLNEDSRLLVHLFNSINNHLENESQVLPTLESKNSPKAFLEDIWETLLSGNNKRIFIFIDEFEELLTEPNVLKKIVKGVKEAINNTTSVFSEGNKYEGRLHIFISCTPDAYYKIQVQDDTRLIMGGVDRRIDKIRLSQIKRKEGLAYLMKLLKYSYDNKLPNPLPIKNLSLFNTLFRISQGNLGNLTSLFVKLFISLKNGTDLNILDNENLINFLKNSEISVFGGQTPCLDVTNYNNIIEYLDENDKTCTKLFKLFIGELRPINLKELSNFTSKENISPDNYIDLINSEIRAKDKIEHPIIKMAPLVTGKTYKDIESCLRECNYIKSIDNNELFEPYSETMSEFKERISFYELNNKNEVVQKIFLPVNEEDIKSFSDNEVDSDTAQKLKNAFETLISNEEMFLANDSLLNHIYPTPIPPGLVYFNDESEKLKLFRLISHNLNQEFEKNIFNAFSETLEKSKVFNVKNDGKVQDSHIIELESYKTNIKIKTLVSVINGDVNVKDIEKISEILNENYGIHSSIILYNGEFTESAHKEVSIKGLGIENKYSIIDLQINPSLAKELIFGYKSNNESKYVKFVDKELYSEICKTYLENLNFENKIEEWLTIQETKGLIINQIKLTKSPNSRVFADGLKLYLNYEGSYTPVEIHEKNQNGILHYKKYGGRGGLIASDFEDTAKQIINVSEDLHKNGFLEKLGDLNGENAIYKVKVNPIEKRLLKIIENKKTVKLKNLKTYFIIKDKNENTLQEVYLNILEYKGLIKRKGPKEDYYYQIVNKEDAFNDLKKYYQSYKDTIESENFRLFGHYYERKQKSDKLIMLNEFDEFVTKTFNELESSFNKKTAPLKINICNKLLSQFENNFEKAMEKASTNSPFLIGEIETKKSELDNSFDNISDKSREWLRIGFKKEDIIDYSGLKIDYNDILSINERYYTKEELEEEIKKIEGQYKKKFGKDEYKNRLRDVFDFNKDNEAEPYFNIKFYLLKEKKEKLNEKIEVIQRKIEEINLKFDEIEKRQSELKKRLDKIKITLSPNNKIAYYMYNQLKSANIVSNKPIKTLEETLELSALIQSSENSIKQIGDRIGLVIKFAQLIENISKTEETFLKKLKYNKQVADKYNNLCDVERFKKDLREFNEEIQDYEIKYEELDMEELGGNKDKRKKIIKLLNVYITNLGLSKDAIELEWDNFQSKNSKFAVKIENIIDIIVKKEEIKENNEIKEIKEKIYNLKDLSQVTLNKTDIPASYMESMKETLNKESREIVAHYLDDNERRLLLTLENKKEGWLDYDEIKEITKELNMEENVFENAMDGLVEKGYLQKGFSLNI